MSKKKSITIIHEELFNEVSALRRAVESKSAAIVILRSELQACQQERDKFRLLAEQHPKPRPSSVIKPVLRAEDHRSVFVGGSERTLAQILCQTKEENKQARSELNELRCRLHDAQSDLKVLREEKLRQNDSIRLRQFSNMKSQLAQQEKQDLIQQIEHYAKKCCVLERDVRSLLEEKEELISEREDNHGKLHRLNYMLNIVLNSNETPAKVINLDTLVSENRYLQQKINQHKREKQLAISSAKKYKSLLEEHRLKWPSMSSTKVPSIPVSKDLMKANDTELRIICATLMDTINQKSEVIKSHKTANRMLLERISSLEKAMYDGNSPESPNHLSSEALLNGYNPLIKNTPTVHKINKEDASKVIEESPIHSAKEECNNFRSPLDGANDNTSTTFGSSNTMNDKEPKVSMGLQNNPESLAKPPTITLFFS